MKQEDANNDLIIKSNALVEAMSKLSLQQLRLLALISANIPKQVELKHFKTEISVPYFMQQFNIKSNAYERLEVLVTSMQSEIVELKEGKKRIKVNLFMKSEYIDDEARISVEIHEDLLPHLSNLSKHYTNYRIKDIYQFKSAHTWRVYELMAQYKTAGKRELQIEDIRFSLGLDEGKKKKYPRVTDLKNWVVKPAIEEINKLSDLFIEWKIVKRGRKITGFFFNIQKKERPESNGPVIDLKKKKTGKKVEKKTSLLNDVNLDKYRDKNIGDMTEEEQRDAIHTALKAAGVHDGPAKKIENAVIEQELDYKNVICETINCMRGQYSSILGTKPKLNVYIAGGLLKKFKLKD